MSGCRLRSSASLRAVTQRAAHHRRISQHVSEEREPESLGLTWKKSGKEKQDGRKPTSTKNCWLGASEQGTTPPEASSEWAVKGEQNTSSDEIIFHYLSVSHWLIFKHSDRREASVPTKKLQLLTRPSGKSQFIINMFINWFFFKFLFVAEGRNRKSFCSLVRWGFFSTYKN